MPTRKDRRHSGRTYPESTIKGKKKEIVDKCLEPAEQWDDWIEHRDGCRGYDDKTRIRPKQMSHADVFEVEKYNKKNKKLLKVRKAKKSVAI